MFTSHLIELTTLLIGIILSIYILGKMRIYTQSGRLFLSPDEIDREQQNGLVEIGGLGIFPILLIALSLSLGISSWLNYYEIIDIDRPISGNRILQIFAGSGLLYIVGLKSDVNGTYSHTRFLALLAASALFPLAGLWIRDLQGLFGIHAISPWVGIPLTIVLSMYITSAISLLDDIDGLGIGLTTIMLGIFCGLSLGFGFTLGAVVTGAGLSICLPYTILKLYHPTWKKTLVGFAGSYVLGYIVAYSALALLAPANIDMPHGTLMIVLGVMFVPMVDLLRALKARVQQGRSIQTPDRNLIQHQLIRMGFPESWIPLYILILIVSFATFNTIWVLREQDITLLAIVDLIVWAILQAGGQYLIRHNENHDWQIAYDRKVFETSKPIENFEVSCTHTYLKRGFDIVLSALLMVIFSPIILVCYIAIRLSDHGPAIYRQERIGRGGKAFWLYKFRSMRVDAEKDGPALSHSAGEGDDRITPIGRFLRAHHLDELPQLWNVLRGDMSFVGYRPERKFYIDQIVEQDERYTLLYQIQPGVTSYATLYNGYTDTMEKMLRRLSYDLYYLEHRSVGFDLRILWATFLSILFGKEF